ncbi:hypothetical protein C8Q76DRAFT_568679, partial [Earliella scabrosa]
RKNRATVEDATDEESGRPWITVQRRRARAHSTGSYPTDTRPVLTTPQRETVRSAEAALTGVERTQYNRRMEAVRAVDQSADDSPLSRGEGPSRDKGKAVDARNWGAVGIPDHELSPDAQRREFELYSTEKSLNENIFDDYDSDEQREMLEYWRAYRQ